jgi:hypothetical protein
MTCRSLSLKAGACSTSTWSTGLGHRSGHAATPHPAERPRRPAFAKRRRWGEFRRNEGGGEESVGAAPSASPSKKALRSLFCPLGGTMTEAVFEGRRRSPGDVNPEELRVAGLIVLH